MKLLLDENLSRRLVPFLQHVKVLLDNRQLIEQVLLEQGQACVEVSTSA